jgi:hypothetical protein
MARGKSTIHGHSSPIKTSVFSLRFVGGFAMFDDTTISPRLARYVWGLYRFIHPQFLALENDDYDQLIRGSRFHSSESMWAKGGIYLEDSKSIRRIPSIRVYRAI